MRQQFSDYVSFGPIGGAGWGQLVSKATGGERALAKAAVNLVTKLWTYRELTIEFVKRDVRDRHAGQASASPGPPATPYFYWLCTSRYSLLCSAKASGVSTYRVTSQLTFWLDLSPGCFRGAELQL